MSTKTHENKVQEIVGKTIIEMIGPSVDGELFMVFSDKTCARFRVVGQFYGELLSEGIAVFVDYPVPMKTVLKVKKMLEKSKLL